MKFNLLSNYVLKSILLILLLFYYSTVHAAPGKGNLEGIIRNVKGEEIPGATVFIVGSNPPKGEATGPDGFYRILGLQEGTYSIQISSIGYKSVIAEVKIIAGQTTNYNAKLEEENTQLDEVVISAPSKTDRLGISSRASMISEIKNSRSIITGISGEQITRSVDFDAAEVAKRLPGVTLINNFLMVRGLGERYNVTFINGMIAPSTEANSRAFSFDMLPSNMLDRLVVYRSPSPDLPSDFAGGVVKIFTRNTAQQRTLQINIAGQYRPGSSLTTFNSYNVGKRDWLGFDDGTRAMPKGLPAKNQIPNISASSSAEDLQANANYGKLFKNNWNLRKTDVDFDKRLAMNYYDSWKIGSFKLNNLTSFSYSRTSNKEEAKSFRGGEFTGTKSTPEWSEVSDIRAARIGGMQIFDFIINESNHIEFRNIFNQFGRDEVIERTILDTLTGDQSGTLYSKYKELFYDFRSRGLYAGNLAGDHSFGETSSSKLNWGLGFSRTTEDSPDQRLIEIGVPRSSESNINSYVFTPSKKTTNRAQSRTFIDAFENTYTGMLDYEKKFSFGPSVKVGGFLEDRERVIDGRTFFYKRSPFQGQDSIFYTIPEPGEDFSDAFSPDNFRPDGTRFNLFEDNDYSNSYIAGAKTYAGYLALNIPLFNQKLNIYGGVRYDKTIQEITLKSNLGSSDDTLNYKSEYEYFLPSINLNYNISSKVILRGAFGTTLNKPQLRELTPTATFDYRYNTEITGNPKLGIAKIQNFDIRLEWFPTTSDFISVGAFYKKFNNIIEDYVRRGDVALLSSPNNAPTAKAYGVEAEVRKSLSFIEMAVIKDLAVIANLSLTHSSSSTDFFNYRKDTTAGAINNVPKSRPIQGSVPYVVNVSLYYDNLKLGTKFSLIYNAFGRRLWRIGDNSEIFNQYESERSQLDLVLRQRIAKNIDLNAGIQDVFNRKISYYRDVDNNVWYTPDLKNKLGRKDYIEREFRPGSYYTLGLIITL